MSMKYCVLYSVRCAETPGTSLKRFSNSDLSNEGLREQKHIMAKTGRRDIMFRNFPYEIKVIPTLAT